VFLRRRSVQILLGGLLTASVAVGAFIAFRLFSRPSPAEQARFWIDDWRFRSFDKHAPEAEEDWRRTKLRIGQVFEDLEKDITFRPYQRLAIMYFAEGEYRQAHQKSQKAIQISQREPEAFDVYLAAFARDGRWLRSLRHRMESTWAPERIRYVSAAILWADAQYDALIAFSEADLSDDASAGFQVENKWQAWTLLLRARALTLRDRHKEAAATIDCIVGWSPAMAASDRTGLIEHNVLYVACTIAETYYRAGRKEDAKKFIRVLLPALENYGVSWESQLKSIRAMAIDLDCLPPAKVG